MNEKNVVKSYNLLLYTFIFLFAYQLFAFITLGLRILTCIIVMVLALLWELVVLKYFLLYPCDVFMKYEIAEDNIVATHILRRKRKSIAIDDNTYFYTFKVRAHMDVFAISKEPLSSKEEALKKRNEEQIMVLPTTAYKNNKTLLSFYAKATNL